MAQSRQRFLSVYVFGAIVAVFLFGGCAKVSINKVPTPNSIGEWAEGDKAKADNMEGLRFYRPRPYVAIKKPFPIGGDDFFIVGDVDGTGNVITVDVSGIPPDLAYHFRLTGNTKTAAIPLSTVRVNLPGSQASADNGVVTAGQNSASSGVSTVKSQGSTGTGGNAASQPAPPANKTEVKTKANIITGGDPQSLPKIDVNSYFDLVYLPDFTEQYAIQVKAGLGSASADIGLENGWMLERSNMSMDNSALGQFIFSNIEKFIDIAVDVTKAAIHPATMLAPESADKGDIPLMEGEGVTERAKKGLANKKVLLRIRYALEAQPGLYPILKPWERVIHTEHPDNKKTSTFDNAKYVHLPYRPYTVIAFNVRKMVAIDIVNIEKPTKPGSTTRPANGDGQTKKRKLSVLTADEKTEISLEALKTTLLNAIAGLGDDAESITVEEITEVTSSDKKNFDTITLTISSSASTPTEMKEKTQKVELTLEKEWNGTDFIVNHGK